MRGYGHQELGTTCRKLTVLQPKPAQAGPPPCHPASWPQSAVLGGQPPSQAVLHLGADVTRAGDIGQGGRSLSLGMMCAIEKIDRTKAMPGLTPRICLRPLYS